MARPFVANSAERRLFNLRFTCSAMDLTEIVPVRIVHGGGPNGLFLYLLAVLSVHCGHMGTVSMSTHTQQKVVTLHFF